APRDNRAQTAGAVAGLIIGLDSMPPRAVNSTSASRMAMQQASGSGGATMVGATISNAVAARLFGRPVDQLSVGASGQPVSAAWNYAWRMSPTPARNVIAILPGSDPARSSEFVLVGAHNDHL